MSSTADHVLRFAAVFFFFIAAVVCTVGHAIFNMADVNIFLLWN